MYILTEIEKLSVEIWLNWHWTASIIINFNSNNNFWTCLIVVRSVESKADFFADRLRDAVSCMGTKDRQLIRVVVTRCEIDMQEIKRAYQARYQKSLEQDISVWIIFISHFINILCQLISSSIITCCDFILTHLVTIDGTWEYLHM